MVKLILNISGFPSKFRERANEELSQDEIQSDYEKRIINTLNQLNPKLNIKSIEYRNLKKEFTDIATTTYSGLIVKEYILENIEQNIKFENRGYKIHKEGDSISATMILAYVYLSPIDEEGRNIIVAQTIFPSLMENIDNNLSASSFSMLNHPIIFINLVDTKLPDSVILDLALIIAAGILYVDVFDTKSINPKNIPRDIENFAKEYDIDSISFDTSNKKLKIKEPPSNILKKNASGKWDFNGSKEKFYWIKVLSSAIIAVNNDYSINYSEYEDFIATAKSRLSPKSDKMARCNTLLEYLKKLSLKKKYHETI